MTGLPCLIFNGHLLKEDDMKQLLVKILCFYAAAIFVVFICMLIHYSGELLKYLHWPFIIELIIIIHVIFVVIALTGIFISIILKKLIDIY